MTTTTVKPIATKKVPVADIDATGSEGDVATQVGGVMVLQAPAAGGLAAVRAAVGLRLTLTTAVPVTTSDVTAAGTIYFTPYTSNEIATYDSSVWTQHVSAEISLALASLSSAHNYDVFAYWTGSAVALELSAAWSSDTARADALARQDGVLVKSSDHSRRYVGTIRTTGTTTTEDSAAQRFVFNQYNRVSRALVRLETTNSWTYNSSTYRQARATSTNQVAYVTGDDAQEVDCEVRGASSSSSNTAAVGIGVDSTSTEGSTLQHATDALGGATVPCNARYKGTPGLGFHKLVWLESVNASSATFFGGGISIGVTGNYVKSGMVGTVVL